MIPEAALGNGLLPPEDRKTIAVIGALPDSFIVFRKDLVKSLAACGHRVVACASSRDQLFAKVVDDPIEKIRALGCEFVDTPTDRTSVDPAGDLRTMRWFTNYLRDLKPDVVMTYTQKQVIFTTLAAIKAGVPRVVPMITGIGFGLNENEGTWAAPIVRNLYRFALRKTPKVIFQNPDDLALFRRLKILRQSHETVIVNGSGVDISHFQPTPFPEAPLTFLLIGRLMKAKGVFEYVEAARILKDRGRNIRVVLAGPSEAHPDALDPDQIKKLVETGLIEYLGSLKDVRPAINGCHVYVLPSYHEGTPKTVLEAMASGRPIIVTDAPGCRETIVPGENGFMVPLRDAQGLADAMDRFVNEPGLIPVFGKRSREIAETKYASDIVTRQVAAALGVRVI